MAPRQKLSYVDDAVSVGRRLRAAREQAGISQRALSFPGCTAAYISRIENGERIPSLQLLREFAARLSVSEQYLAYGRDDVPVPRTTRRPRLASRSAWETSRRRASSRTAGLDGARSDAERQPRFRCSARWRWPKARSSPRARRSSALPRSIRRSRSATRGPPSRSGRMYARAFEYEIGRGGLRAEPRPGDRRAATRSTRCDSRSLLANAQIDCGQLRRRRGGAGRRDQGERDRGRPAHGGADVLVAVAGCTATSRTPRTPRATPSARSSCSRRPTSTTTSRAATSCSRTSSSSAATTSWPPTCSTARRRRSPPAAASSSSRASGSSRRASLLKANRREEAGAIAMEASAEHGGPERRSTRGEATPLLASVFAELGDEERAIELYELAIEQLEATPNR